MNQILSTEMNRGKSRNKTTKTIDIKKILIFFAIAIIILGLAMLVKGAYENYSNTKENEEIKSQQTEPEVELEQSDEEVTLTVNHDKSITKIEYNWNDGQAVTINGNNRTSVTQTITLPDGTNKLTVKVTDEIGSVATIQKTFTKIEENLALSFALVENKLKITATDARELSHLTYKWNSEEEKTIKVDEDASNKNLLEVEIEIPEGLNTLTVVVTNKNGQTKTKTQEIEGVTAPKISVQRDGEYLILNVKDESIVTLINFTLNNQPYRINLTVYDADYYNAIQGLTVKTNANGDIIEMEYRQLMTEKGMNVLTLTAENKKNAKATYTGQCNNI